MVTFGIGPAGTGKSYLAVALAVQALQAREADRIILTRPAVEAGERLGFLPGDIMAKVDPYLRPLYDALYDLLGPEGAQRLLERGTIEVAPLAFMRGRTLNRSFIILDEAQNTTPEQMKMFLTRIGFGSKVVVTGDVTQIDVPGGRSGLPGLEAVLGAVPEAGLRAPDPARRGAGPHRGRHRRPPTSGPTTPTARGRRGRRTGVAGPPAHRAIGTEAARWWLTSSPPTSSPTGPSTSAAGSQLARDVLGAQGVKDDIEVSLLFVDEPTIAELHERFLGRAGTHRRAGLSHRRGARARRALPRRRRDRARRRCSRATSDMPDAARRRRGVPVGGGPQRRPSTA